MSNLGVQKSITKFLTFAKISLQKDHIDRGFLLFPYFLFGPPKLETLITSDNEKGLTLRLWPFCSRFQCPYVGDSDSCQAHDLGPTTFFIISTYN